MRMMRRFKLNLGDAIYMLKNKPDRDNTKLSGNYLKQKVKSFDSNMAMKLKRLKMSFLDIISIAKQSPANERIIFQIFSIIEELDMKNHEKLLQQLSKIDTLASPLNSAQKEPFNVLRVPLMQKLALEVKEEVNSDLKELEKSFNAGCFRASVILCGKVLETCLHRLYFEKTGFDILEKNPGIGLGTLIAKLAEKGITLDPGLTQQIHLINQVRIFTVHKKKTVFNPTKQQAYAIVLYTLDVLNKLFK